MPFSTRNALYLRISSYTVLPLYLYLDGRHVEWMSDHTLQLVLEDLRPKLVRKLQTEDPNKKSQVEVHRGSTYQFAFFFRKTDSRHVVLLKKREYHLRSTRLQSPPPVSDPFPPRPHNKRARSSSVTSSSTETDTGRTTGNGKRRRAGTGHGTANGRSRSVSLRERSGEELLSDDEDESGDAGAASSSSRPDLERRRSARSTPRTVDYSEEPDPDVPSDFGREETPLNEIQPEDELDPIIVKTEPLDQEFTPSNIFGADEDEDEERQEEYGMGNPMGGRGAEEVDDKKDLKPEMRLSYTGFSIASRQLVLIIEPFPALEPDPARSASVRLNSRSRSTFSRATSREVHLHRFGSASASDFGSPTPSERGMSQTPLLSVPNSRRGGIATGSGSGASPTPTPAPPGGLGETARVGAAAIAAGINANSSRDASVANRRSQTPLMMNPRYTASLRNTPRATPDFGPGGDGLTGMEPPDSRNRDRTPLFGRDTPFEDIEDDVEEEDDEWRRDARASSYAPFRGGSVAPDIDYVDDDEDDELMNEARGVLAMSQSLQSHTELRAGKSMRASGDGDEGDLADGDGEDVGDGVGGPE